MKILIAITFFTFTLISTNGRASNSHEPAPKTKAPHAGDTVWPGSPGWVHAGSPRSSITGDSIALIWGADGILHPLGYAIEDTNGSWIGNTLENRNLIEDHRETMRLTVAVREIMQMLPDRKILKVRKGRRTVASPDTGYNPFMVLMHWVDSIAKKYNDPYFLEEEQQLYERPRGFILTPLNYLSPADNPNATL
ncbi:MAG TPA: hypothetical protein VG537_03535 [Candidatus Kapabacteria bacterium]|nr:hypothetical protein [Candidatus Kapabacteria bacterium]